MNRLTPGVKALLSTLPAICLATTFQASGADIRVEHLGPNNTYVRIEGDASKILLPVEDSQADSRINIIVDGRLDKSIAVKLAKDTVDFHVPLDLSPYKGKSVLLNVLGAHGHQTVAQAKDDVCWTSMEFADEYDPANTERYRPAFHHTPQWGWMNDPNGMYYADGRWHLYYQYNPYGSKWQNLSWGHSSSSDLIHWERHPVALEPDGLGMIFSGSCALDPGNTAGFGSDAVIAMYTSADASQTQSLAWSLDGGDTFSKLPTNPVITLESEARDPNMFWDKENKQWVLLLAHALDHEMLVFTSSDMKRWTRQSAFGKGLGAQDGVWECPDLFRLPIQGTDRSKWVLICNINPGGPFGGSGTQYFTGDFDGKTFTADTDAQGNVATKWMDFGKDNYASVSWSDAPADRRVIIGWMGNWQYADAVPTKQFRSANTLPRDLSLFEAPDGEIYLCSTPSPELLSMRDKVVAKAHGVKISSKAKEYRLPASTDGICEILIDLKTSANSGDGLLYITLGNAKGEKAVMTYNPSAHTLSFDRRESGLTDFSKDFPAVTCCPTFETDGSVSLRLFIDRSSVEIFGDDGRFSMTNLVFPTESYTTLSISAKNTKAVLKDLKVYSIKL